MTDPTPRHRGPFGINVGDAVRRSRRARRVNGQLSDKVEDLQDQIDDLEDDLNDAEDERDEANRRMSDAVAYGQQLHALLVQSGITPPPAPSGFFA